jgi:hypothetical protein
MLGLVAGITYTVRATLPDEAVAAEYGRWLTNGHIQAVLAAGALSAMVVRLREPAAPICVESRYVFPNREALDRYLRGTAPGLRAEGLRRFPPERGVGFERTIGEVVGEGRID